MQEIQSATRLSSEPMPNTPFLELTHLRLCERTGSAERLGRSLKEKADKVFGPEPTTIQGQQGEARAEDTPKPLMQATREELDRLTKALNDIEYELARFDALI